MSVSIEDIKKLRDLTGVSMSACKSALEESNGDLDGAVEVLRKKGEAKAADRAERSTGEGAVEIKVVDDKAAVVELLCETDFVARSDDFHAFAQGVADKLISGEFAEGAVEVEGLTDAVSRLGENVRLGRTKLVSGSTLGFYVHSNGKIGVVVSLEGGNEEMARDIAMQIAATNPFCINPADVPADQVEKEKVIWVEQLSKEGKPAEIVEKIMMGKENKFREERSLLKQDFLKNPDLTIEGLLAGAKVVEFVRFAI